MHNSNDKPDLTQFAAIENSTPLGLVAIDGAEITPHAQSRSFMDRIKDLGAEVVVNAYGGGAAGVVAGGVLGALSLSGVGAFIGSSLVGGAAGLVLGVGYGAVTGLFQSNKNDMTLKQRIEEVRENIIDFTTLRKAKTKVDPSITPKI